MHFFFFFFTFVDILGPYSIFYDRVLGSAGMKCLRGERKKWYRLPEKEQLWQHQRLFKKLRYFQQKSWSTLKKQTRAPKRQNDLFIN